tara:strand:- start:361 stop:525 length:165 start_codon:yes stop_codon:yes gene_type:complete
MKIMRDYKYRLYPAADQESRLSAWVVAARAVYNAALEQRKKGAASRSAATVGVS